MSDVMLHGVLNMPIELWRDDPVDQIQRQARYIEASKRLERLKTAYIKLTNCEQYGEDGEVKGHFCPNALLKEFDDCFDS